MLARRRRAAQGPSPIAGTEPAGTQPFTFGLTRLRAAQRRLVGPDRRACRRAGRSSAVLPLAQVPSGGVRRLPRGPWPYDSTPVASLGP